jgi:hypothetical protein
LGNNFVSCQGVEAIRLQMLLGVLFHRSYSACPIAPGRNYSFKLGLYTCLNRKGETFNFFWSNHVSVDAGSVDIHPISFGSEKMAHESHHSWFTYETCKDLFLRF